MKYGLIISKSVSKQVDKLPENVKPRIFARILSLAEVPRPEGVSKLKGYSGQYRVRVGSYRIRYEVDDGQATVKILQCKHRKDVYKDKD